MVTVQDLVESISPYLGLRRETYEGVEAIVFPVEGIDGYALQLWIERVADGWRLSDDGALVGSLLGVKEEDVARRIATIADDLPVALDDLGHLIVSLNGSAPENARVLSTTIEAFVSCWALSLQQQPPKLQESTAKRVGRWLSSNNVPFTMGTSLPGRSGFDRHFDVAVSFRGTRLLRTSETQDPSHLKQSAELYAFHVGDVATDMLFPSPPSFFWTWNSERIPRPDERILRLLDNAEIHAFPSEAYERVAAALAGPVRENQG